MRLSSRERRNRLHATDEREAAAEELRDGDGFVLTTTGSSITLL